MIGKQITECDHNRKQVALAAAILCSNHRKLQLFVQGRIRNVIARLIGKQSLTVCADISELCKHAQILFQLLPVHFCEILCNSGLNILRRILIKL